MKIEVLVSTMHQGDLSIADKMNIKGNAIIINQCDTNSYIERKEDNRYIRMYSFDERGVGKSRNNALMRSDADVCVMADDDIVYVGNYEELIIKGFEKNPKADMIMFNAPNTDKSKYRLKVKKSGRIRFYNYFKFGTINIAFKREKILKSNIFFSLLFGGGARYSSGEDSLFIADCLKNGVKIYGDTSKIAEIHQNRDSTWFTGFNEKYFFDRGALFGALSRKLSWVLILQFAVRKHSMYKNELSFREALKYMWRGLKHYRTQ
ncbi:glycosyltransferase family A protein [Proteiniborus sp. MB09-C3]|uniref:glycosyltransferase family A protein n=1 Tax=Proteiniborus sp. MB09-C3 TaxID=3050072 RepID=UPI002556DAC0|nr:glycosyltransferase family A protein [Proteiniborus sp. MB09-C3]WIV12077.1 glycosyltransferase family A protein [Proteiniborus sp. MB09-C3]